MIEWSRFAETLARYARVENVAPDDILFREGLNLSSIDFAEFILDLEEEFGLDIDVDALGPEIRTAGQLREAIEAQGPAGP